MLYRRQLNAGMRALCLKKIKSNFSFETPDKLYKTTLTFTAADLRREYSLGNLSFITNKNISNFDLFGIEELTFLVEFNQSDIVSAFTVEKNRYAINNY